MPPDSNYELLPTYASPSSSASSPRLRSHRNPILTTNNTPRLSIYRSRSTSPVNTFYPHKNRRRVCSLCAFPAPRLTRVPALIFWLIKYIVPLCSLALLVGFFLYEPHIELAFYNRGWIKQEVMKMEPLAGCFRSEKVSAKYNVSEYVYGPKKVDFHSGVPLEFGLDCYNFAGTIQSRPPANTTHLMLGEGEERTVYHTYWRTDLASFGQRQEWMIKSFFATQNPERTKLILWSNGDLSSNKIIGEYLKRYPDRFQLEVADIPSLAKGTLLEGSPRLSVSDRRAWTDGDLLRLLLLWQYGGIWADMDSLFTRDLEPLLEHEFVTQWDCYDKPYSAFNGAFLRFRKHSPYLCEAFHIMANSTPPRPRTTDWGSILYLKLWRRLVAEGIPPFKILPFCFNDGRSCRLDNRLPDPFVPDPKNNLWTEGLTMGKGGGLDDVLNKVFVVHLHNQWDKDFPKGGWVDRLLLKKYDSILGN